MKLSFWSAAFLAASVVGAHAACPERAPRVGWNTQSGDARVSAEFLAQNLAGKRVGFSGGGTEHYRGNGSYRFSAGGQTFRADGYKFYENGVRCIGYAPPRFDLYVVNNGKLILVNEQGGRFEAKIR
ncbi:MAG: hypothetical protein AAFY38_06100 [Pseudomonadota bacterium]